MAKFAVGMRVRVNCPKSQVHGNEACVKRVGVPGFDEESGDFIGTEIYILCDAEYEFCVFEDHELEPILPEGAAPSIYSYQELMDKLREGERV